MGSLDRALGASLLTAAVLSGCSGTAAPADDDDFSFDPNPGDDDDDATAAPADGLLRIVHAARGVQLVDAWLADYPEPLARGVEFGASSGVMAVDGGAQTLQMRVGDDSGADDPVLVSLDLGVVDGGTRTVVLAEDEELRLWAFEDGWAPTGGDARLRVVHAGTDDTSLALDLLDDGVSELLGLAPGSDSGPEGLPVPAGAPVPLVLLDGDDGSRLTRITLPSPAPGDAHWVVLIGGLDAHPRTPGGLSAVVVGDGLGPGAIRQDPWVTVFWAADGAAVDLHAERELASDLLAGATGDSVQLPAGPVGLAVHAAGPGADPTGPALATWDGAVQAGERYLLVGSGSLGTDFEFHAVEDSFVRGEETARVRALHAAASQGPLSLGDLDGASVVPYPSLSGLVRGLTSPNPGEPLDAGPRPLGAGDATNAAVAGWSGFTLQPDALDLLVLWDGPAGLELQRIETRDWPWSSRTEPCD